MKKLEGSSVSKGLWAVYLLGWDSTLVVDLEWGVVFIIAANLCMRYKIVLYYRHR